MRRAPIASFLRIVGLAMCLLPAVPSAGWTWGWATHAYIAQHYSQHLPPFIDGLRAYDADVVAHVSDPDTRKGSTPGESVKHYIDIDLYPEFLAGTLPHDRAALEALYGSPTVQSNGVLPWAIGDAVSRLRQQFAAQQWSAAALTIADLCHYVGDATQPLHCTKNFDGQLTGNSGIHSRYEGSMMNLHLAELSTPAIPVGYRASAVEAAFDVIEASWAAAGTVLTGDNAGKAAGSVGSTVYYDYLWAYTQVMTRARVDSATVMTAALVYSAWEDAGRPVVPGSSANVDPVATLGDGLFAGPSPFRDALSIRYGGPGPLNVDVFDVRGARVARLVEGAASGGTVTWRPAGGEAHVPPGLYFVRLSAPGMTRVRQVSLLK